MKVKSTKKKPSKKAVKKSAKKTVEETTNTKAVVLSPVLTDKVVSPLTLYRPSVWRSFVGAARRTWTRFHRLLPRLVWYGKEVDVLVTFTIPNEHTERVVATLRDAGINFDSGLGPAGRDLYLDWSLSGPMRIKFFGNARNPVVRV